MTFSPLPLVWAVEDLLYQIDSIYWSTDYKQISVKVSKQVLSKKSYLQNKIKNMIIIYEVFDIEILIKRRPYQVQAYNPMLYRGQRATKFGQINGTKNIRLF